MAADWNNPGIYRDGRIFWFLVAIVPAGKICPLSRVWDCDSESYSIHGIDVSKYQELVAWEEVKAMQVKK